MTLSSDSGSLHDSGSFSDEHRIDDDDEELTPKSSKIAKVKKSKSTAIGGSSAKSSSKKTLEATSLKVEDQTPSRRKKLDTQKEKNGTLDIWFVFGVISRWMHGIDIVIFMINSIEQYKVRAILQFDFSLHCHFVFSYYDTGKNEEKKITDESDIDKQTEHKVSN